MTSKLLALATAVADKGMGSVLGRVKTELPHSPSGVTGLAMSQLPPKLPLKIDGCLWSLWKLSNIAGIKKPASMLAYGRSRVFLNEMVVELIGIEPTTLALRTLRSPN